MGRFQQVDAAWIDHNQFRALAQALAHLGSEHRVGVGGVGTDDDHGVGLHDGIKGLGPGGLTHGGLQTKAGGRMTDPRTGISVVVAERGADQLLHQIGFLVCAA